jgi:hypothetical protein
MFASATIEKIIETWIADQKHPERYRKQKPIPDEADVRFLVETAFWASLKKEENRPISFSIALLTKEEVEQEFELSGRRQLIMTFERSLPLSVDSLTKIAPAFNPQYTALIIEPENNARTNYRIWGAMYFSSLSNPLKEIPVWIEDQTFVRPDVFMVTAISPGSLMISRGNSQIGRFVSGEFIKAVPTPFSSWAMGNYIKNIYSEASSPEFFKPNFWHTFSAALDYLLSEVSYRSHGASLIIIPDFCSRDYRNLYSRRYTFPESLQINNMIQALIHLPTDTDNSILRLGYNKKISERLGALSQLACVDGALVITEKFEVLSFGSTLRAPRWKGQVIVGPYGFSGGGENFERRMLGTRHHSVMNFIGECAESIGFVISQDGPIRGFIKKDSETLLCWPDCRVSMFI